MSKPMLVFNKKSKIKSEVTIVMPIYNQDNNIRRILQYLIQNLSLPSEIILINDNSSDNTLQVIKNYVEKMTEEMHSIFIYTFKSSAYETKCDSFGISIATTKYIIEIQADMLISDPGFDNRLLSAIRSREDIFMVSGRAAETWAKNAEEYRKSLGSCISWGDNLFIFSVNQFRGLLGQFLQKILRKQMNNKISYKKKSYFKTNNQSQPSIFFESGVVGILGEEVQYFKNYSIEEMQTLYLSETVMRGPLIIDKAKYDSLNGFDVNRFFLAFDDHDLTLRGWINKGFRSGYTPINFCSPSEDGSTRKSRGVIPTIELINRLFKIRNVRKTSALYKYNDTLNKPPREIIEYKLL